MSDILFPSTGQDRNPVCSPRSFNRESLESRALLRNDHFVASQGKKKRSLSIDPYRRDASARTSAHPVKTSSTRGERERER